MSKIAKNYLLPVLTEEQFLLLLDSLDASAGDLGNGAEWRTKIETLRSEIEAGTALIHERPGDASE